MPETPIPAPDSYITEKSFATLAGASAVVWFITNASYNISNSLVSKGSGSLDRQIFCLVVAGILSTVAATIAFRKKVTASERWVAVTLFILNVFMIFSSANGYQAVYSGVTFPDDENTTKSFVIPFLSPQPWLAPKVLVHENKALHETVAIEERQIDTVRGEVIAANKTIELSKQTMNLRDDISDDNLKENIQQAINALDTIQTQQGVTEKERNDIKQSKATITATLEQLRQDPAKRQEVLRVLREQLTHQVKPRPLAPRVATVVRGR